MELLRVSYEEAKRLISSHRKALDKIAAYLIRKETITGKEFMIIFRAVEKGLEVSDELDAEGLKALDEAVKAENKAEEEANAEAEPTANAEAADGEETTANDENAETEETSEPTDQAASEIPDENSEDTESH